jgi:hypothetical protein
MTSSDNQRSAVPPQGEVERTSITKNVGIIATVLVLLALYATACGTSTGAQFHTEKFSKSSFKGTWSLIPDSGVLACEGGAVTFTPTGTNDTYAVNATPAMVRNWSDG